MTALAAIEARAAAATAGVEVQGGRRCAVEQSANLDGWWIGVSPRNGYGAMVEGPWEDWQELAEGILGVTRAEVAELLAALRSLRAHVASEGERVAAAVAARSHAHGGELAASLAAMERARDRALAEADHEVATGAIAHASQSRHYALACGAVECIDALTGAAPDALAAVVAAERVAAIAECRAIVRAHVDNTRDWSVREALDAIDAIAATGGAQ